MRVLDLEDWENGSIGKALTQVKTLGAMLYPDDETRQDEVCIVWVIRCIAAAEEAGNYDLAELLRILLPEGSFQLIRRLPSEEERSKRDARASFCGMVSGDILLHIIQLESCGYGGSVNKAVHLLESSYRDSRTPRGQGAPCNPTTIRNAWASHKSVCHLWAAERVITDAFFSEQNRRPEPTAFLTPEFQEYNNRWWQDDFPTFLACAESFRQIGIHHIPHGQKTPLLSPDETWSCEGAIPLPAVRLPIPPLTERAQEWLNQYRAPIRL